MRYRKAGKLAIALLCLTIATTSLANRQRGPLLDAALRKAYGKAPAYDKSWPGFTYEDFITAVFDAYIDLDYFPTGKPKPSLLKNSIGRPHIEPNAGGRAVAECEADFTAALDDAIRKGDTKHVYAITYVFAAATVSMDSFTPEILAANVRFMDRATRALHTMGQDEDVTTFLHMESRIRGIPCTPALEDVPALRLEVDLARQSIEADKAWDQNIAREVAERNLKQPMPPAPPVKPAVAPKEILSIGATKKEVQAQLSALVDKGAKLVQQKLDEDARLGIEDRTTIYQNLLGQVSDSTASRSELAAFRALYPDLQAAFLLAMSLKDQTAVGSLGLTLTELDFTLAKATPARMDAPLPSLRMRNRRA